MYLNDDLLLACCSSVKHTLCYGPLHIALWIWNATVDCECEMPNIWSGLLGYTSLSLTSV